MAAGLAGEASRAGDGLKDHPASEVAGKANMNAGVDEGFDKEEDEGGAAPGNSGRHVDIPLIRYERLVSKAVEDSADVVARMG